jgi:hypothetical protein
VDQRVDQDLAHRIGRNERAVYPLQSARLDAPRQWEVALAEELGLLEQLEGRAAYVALVEEFGFVATSDRILITQSFADEHQNRLRIEFLSGEDVLNMLVDGPHILLKQLRHDFLSQPNRFAFPANIYARCTVFSLVENDR